MRIRPFLFAALALFATAPVAAMASETGPDCDCEVCPPSTIKSNFNGTKIKAGSTIWFNSHLKVSGPTNVPFTITVGVGEITSSAFTVQTPRAEITFVPWATVATTTFDDSTQTWITTVPSGLGGNVFASGVGLPAPFGLPGGLNPVTWKTTFYTDTQGVSISWQWSAAVYTQFPADLNDLDVKPVDSNNASLYLNSHHAGTPERIRSFVVGGARGGGGSNFTGSWSATGSHKPCYVPPCPYCD